MRDLLGIIWGVCVGNGEVGAALLASLPVEHTEPLLTARADAPQFGSTPLTLAVNKDVAALIQEATRKQTVKFRKPDTQPSPRQGRANQQRGRP